MDASHPRPLGRALTDAQKETAMRRIRMMLLAAVLAIPAVAVTMAKPSSAVESDGRSAVFGESLDEFLSAYPNAERLPDDSYQLERGVRLVPPDGAVGIAEYPSGCPNFHLCIYGDKEFKGWSLQFFSCNTVGLGSDHWDRVSSMHNAQNVSTARFIDVDPEPDVEGSLPPNSWWRDMTKDTAPDGRSWDNRIDVVNPC